MVQSEHFYLNLFNVEIRLSQFGDGWQVAEETISVGFNPQGIAVLPDGSKIYVVLQDDGMIEVLSF